MNGPTLSEIQAFAVQHGVIVTDPIISDRVRRVPTVIKPRKRNGAYFYDGERFGVMSWDAGHIEMVWMPREGGTTRTDDPAAAAAWLAKRQKAERETTDRQNRAAAQAEALLAAAEVRTHPYLARKGFPSEMGLVADGVKINIKIENDADEEDRYELRTFDDVLLIPMRIGDNLVGLQRIFYDGQRFDKRYMAGQRTQGAVFMIGNPRARETWLCEGFATGLSIKAALTQLRIDAAVLVTFSAGNLKHMASATRGRRFVFADHDPPNVERPEAGETGQKTAIATGLPWCMSPVVGDDANDLHQRDGLFALAALIMSARSQAPP